SKYSCADPTENPAVCNGSSLTQYPMKKTIQIDPDFLIKLSKAQDALKHRVDYLEEHMENDFAPEAPVAKGFFCNVVFNNTNSQNQTPIYGQQFQAELMSVLKSYNVESFQGFYKK